VLVSTIQQGSPSRALDQGYWLLKWSATPTFSS